MAWKSLVINRPWGALRGGWKDNLGVPGGQMPQSGKCRERLGLGCCSWRTAVTLTLRARRQTRLRSSPNRNIAGVWAPDHPGTFVL